MSLCVLATHDKVKMIRESHQMSRNGVRLSNDYGRRHTAGFAHTHVLNTRIYTCCVMVCSTFAPGT